MFRHIHNHFHHLCEESRSFELDLIQCVLVSIDDSIHSIAFRIEYVPVDSETMRHSVLNRWDASTKS